MRSRHNFALLAFAALAAITMSISLNRVSGQNPILQDEAASKRQQELQIIRQRGGYKEAAKLNGGSYVRDFDPHWDWVQLDTESLVQKSQLVVVGYPSFAVSSRLVADGQMVVTNYEFSVQEVIKGDIQQGSTIKVSLPGGRAVLEDGSSVEFRTPGFERMQHGKTYALFLYKDKPRNDAYDLVAGPQGLFETPGKGMKVRAHGRPTDPASVEVKDKDTELFLQEVRSYGKKYPEPGACCH